MNPLQFTESAPGRLVPTVGSSSDARVAFVPDPLPALWQWPDYLWPKLVKARTCLASLDGTGKHLPNRDIILAPVQQREAQLSSKLEGTITDPKQQALFQVEPRYPTSESDPVNAYREVYNYGQALSLKLDGETDLPLSLRLIQELHRILMDGVRGASLTPGEFRRTQNQINRPARFVPPPPNFLKETLYSLESYLHSNAEVDPLVRAFMAHYQFETIHPFSDGNGRVGRLLLAITISEWCELSSQWLYMSAFFESRKQEYVDLLLKVSTHGAWEEWIDFCLDGVIAQATDTEKRCDQLMSLYRDFQEHLKSVRGGSVRLATIVDRLFRAPVVRVSQLKDEFRIAYGTAKADVSRLERVGILVPLQSASVATYYCPDIFRVVHDLADREVD